MASFGPFEPSPSLAVAVSGGGDSMALALLLHDWVAARQGDLVALTVDHGLRPESGDEARAVGESLRAAGIEQRILTWQGPKPTSGLQAAARAARYDLLTGFCRDHAILHLCLAHHRDDQAETFLLRQERGSGESGLAAMASLRHMAHLRLLRPLLSLSKARLLASARQQGVSWVEDPSNRDPRFARGRLRLEATESGASQAVALSDKARAYGQQRQSQQLQTARFLGRHAALDPAGFLTLDQAALAALPEFQAQQVLAACIASVGGRPYGPRKDRLLRLYEALQAAAFPGATLGRVAIASGRGRLLFCRESRALERFSLVPGARRHWDGRFDVALVDVAPAGNLEAMGRGANEGPFMLRALGHDGLKQLRAAIGRPERAMPTKVLVTLPSLWDDLGLIFVPQLRYSRPDWSNAMVLQATFRPKCALLATYMVV